MGRRRNLPAETSATKRSTKGRSKSWTRRDGSGDAGDSRKESSGAARGAGLLSAEEPESPARTRTLFAAAVVQRPLTKRFEKSATLHTRIFSQG